MAQEIVNRLHCAVKVAADASIIARTYNVGSIVTHTPGTGVYVVTLSEAIAAAECCFDACVDGNTFVDVMVSQISTIQFQVQTALANGGAATDAAFNLCVHRISSSNGT